MWILCVMNSLFWLRLGFWRVVLTWSVCMHRLEKILKCMNIKRTLFFLFCFMAVLLSEAQTEIPGSLWIPRNRLFWRCNYVEKSECVGRKPTCSHEAHPPRSVSETHRNIHQLSVSRSGSGPSHADLEGSQSGRSACSVLCTSSGRSFGLLFAWPG